MRLEDYIILLVNPTIVVNGHIMHITYLKPQHYIILKYLYFRLFDTNEERYEKIKTEISNMIMTQVGLTMFQYDREQDSYISVGYTFHLCPQVVGDINQSLIFQASTLKFLCKHNFNFNKVNDTINLEKFSKYFIQHV